MKNKLNKILEAINKGINLALDDIEDSLDIQLLTHSNIKSKNYTKEYLDLMDIVVDLGLPSGTLWCKYNLDVNSDNLNIVMDWFGGYYAWGELQNKSKQGKSYNWRTYQHCKGNMHNLTKYCNSYANGNRSYTDTLILLLPEDDIAYQKIHLHNFKFHIPTKEQFEELKEYTTKEWIEDIEYNGKFVKGLDGMVFKSIINGNEIFFPAANEADIPYQGYGEYWSSTLYKSDPSKAWSLHFEYDSRELGKLNYLHASARTNGCTIRPVINL